MSIKDYTDVQLANELLSRRAMVWIMTKEDYESDLGRSIDPNVWSNTVGMWSAMSEYAMEEMYNNAKDALVLVEGMK